MTLADEIEDQMESNGFVTYSLAEKMLALLRATPQQGEPVAGHPSHEAALVYLEESTRPQGQMADRAVNAFVAVMLREYQANIAPPAALPDGWVAVPKEPTDEIGAAIYAAWDSFGEDAVMGPHEALAIYRAMLAAAPPAPGAQG